MAPGPTLHKINVNVNANVKVNVNVNGESIYNRMIPYDDVLMMDMIHLDGS